MDFSLCHPAGKPVVFIEAKQVGQSDGGERQLFEYAFHKGVPMVVLTDGQEWHFFLPAEQGDYGERRVYKLDIIEREIDEIVTRLQRYLDYRAICSGEAMKVARADYQNVARDRQIKAAFPEAWAKLVAEEDELLLELLADRVESICGYKPDPDTVAAFLQEKIALKSAVAVPSVPATASPCPVTVPTPATAGERHMNKIGFTLNGHLHSARNARDVFVKVFSELAKQDPTFLERFATLPKHGRTRRYLARTPAELYPERPDLARDFSLDLGSGWWLGVNLSRAAISRIIEMACEVTGLRYGNDLKVNLGE